MPSQSRRAPAIRQHEYQKMTPSTAAWALRPDEAHYWATYQGAELDLLLFKQGRRIGVECKRMDAPVLTPSMHIA
jgi:hypothetical protein